MTVRRGFLYFGVFLVAAGGVVLLTEAGVLDPDAVLAALAWWPLAIIAIGAGLILRRTRAAIPGGIDRGGDARAAARRDVRRGAGPPDARARTSTSRRGPAVTREGAFGSTASVDLSLACGEPDRDDASRRRLARRRPRRHEPPDGHHRRRRTASPSTPTARSARFGLERRRRSTGTSPCRPGRSSTSTSRSARAAAGWTSTALVSSASRSTSTRATPAWTSRARSCRAWTSTSTRPPPRSCSRPPGT